MSIAEKFVSMEYGPAPEDSKEAAGVAGPPRPSLCSILSVANGSSHRPANFSTRVDPSNGEKLASVAQGSRGRC